MTSLETIILFRVYSSIFYLVSKPFVPFGTQYISNYKESAEKRPSVTIPNRVFQMLELLALPPSMNVRLEE